MGDVIKFPEREAELVHTILINIKDNFTNELVFIKGRKVTVEDAQVINNALNKIKTLIVEEIRND